MVYVVACVSVGASFVDAGFAYDGEEVCALVFVVFVEYGLHFFGPSDDELLSGLASAVCDVSVLEVCLAEV